jgi:hypothetical protein
MNGRFAPQAVIPENDKLSAETYQSALTPFV